MNFDVMVCMDTWLDLPPQVAGHINSRSMPKVACDTAQRPDQQHLTGVVPGSDLKEFMREYGRVLDRSGRPAHVLIAGQGWPCATHTEKLGIRALAKFVPHRLRLFIDANCVALMGKDKHDRTCTGEHILADQFVEWRHVEDTIYEMVRIKKPWTGNDQVDKTASNIV